MPEWDAIKCDVGVVGLNAAGRNVALNLADAGFRVAACPGPQENDPAALGEIGRSAISLASNFSDFAARLKRPRAVFLFSEEHAAAEVVLDGLLPHLEEGETIIDAGDSHYKETDRRSRLLAARSIHFIGLGLGVVRQGARTGAVLMPGGSREAYERIRPMFEAISAKTSGSPSDAWLGPAAAGHFVRMVQAGIEHTLSQLSSETFGLMKQTLAMSDEELLRAPGAWRVETLEGYRSEFSANLSRRPLYLANNMAQAAREFGVETPTIEAALGLGETAARQRRRALALTLSRQPVRPLTENPESIFNEAHGAFFAAMMITYAEGLALVAAASAPGQFPFHPAQIASLWKGCGPLRSRLLEEIAAALEATPGLPNPLYDEDLSEKLMEHQEYLRRAVWRAHQLDFMTPAMLAALDYLDSRREAWWPVNLIQVPVRQRAYIPQPV